MKQTIRNRRTGNTQIVAEIDATPKTPAAVRTGLAVRWAITHQADLQWADLAGAKLTGADLTGADLRWADLTRANLLDITCQQEAPS